MISCWQCVRIASVFEFTVFVAWWGRSLELKLLGAHSMQDTACSEAWAQTAEEEQCTFTNPCLSPWFRVFHASLIVSSCFCFFLCVSVSDLFFCFIWYIVPSTPFSAAQVSPFVSELDICLHCESQGQSMDFVHALSMAVVLIPPASPVCWCKYSEIIAAAPCWWHFHY